MVALAIDVTNDLSAAGIFNYAHQYDARTGLVTAVGYVTPTTGHLRSRRWTLEYPGDQCPCAVCVAESVRHSAEGH